MSHAEDMAKLNAKRAARLKMGGADKLAARKDRGQLNARERLERFYDPGSFRELGSLSHSARPGLAVTTPADGKIVGHGLVEERPVLTVANDLTVLGASSAATNMKKIEYVRSLSCAKGLPLVLLGESTGARVPDSMGALGMAGAGLNKAQYRRLREAPWVSVLLGPCFGSSSWYTAMSDVAIMLKGAVMAVSSPLVTRVAIGENTPAQELGGWRLHYQETGMADLVAETEDEALNLARRVLGYLPTGADQSPPRAEIPAGSGDGMAHILDLVPEESHKVYDVREIVRTVFDADSVLELKAGFAKPCVTALARLNGRPVGVIANNPRFGAGALTADCCDKIIALLVLADSYNLPVVMLVDTPGFLVGKAGEKKRVIGKIINWMNALSQVTVPVLTLVIGKSYGQAYLNMGAGAASSVFAAWPTARISFMGPEPALNVVVGLTRDSDPEKFEAALKQMETDVEPWDAAGVFGFHEVIDPADTRTFLTEQLELHTGSGRSQRLLANWPTTF